MLGTRIEKADILSRRPDLKIKVGNDNKDQKLIKEKWIRGIIEVVVEEPETMLVKRVREKYKKVVRVIKDMKKAEVRALRENEWEIKEDLVLKEVYVLKDKKLRLEVIWLHHNVPVVEYKGRWKIIELVMRNLEQKY